MARHIERTLRFAGTYIDLDMMKRKSWPGITAEFVRFSAPTTYNFHLANAPNYIALLNIHRTDGETIVPGYSRSTAKNLRNKMTFVPADYELSGWSCIEKQACVMALYLERHSSTDDASPDLSQIPPMLGFDDNMLRTVVLQLQAILHDPTLDTPGYAETLGVLLAFELARFNAQNKEAGPQQGGLTARQVRLVLEYLESRLTDQITVSELAALVELSRFHFIRAFKQTVGMPPHQYVVHRRIERAKELLPNAQLSVTEIANLSGFNGTTQFTRSFRAIVGQTPSAFRRDIA